MKTTFQLQTNSKKPIRTVYMRISQPPNSFILKTPFHLDVNHWHSKEHKIILNGVYDKNSKKVKSKKIPLGKKNELQALEISMRSFQSEINQFILKAQTEHPTILFDDLRNKIEDHFNPSKNNSVNDTTFWGIMNLFLEKKKLVETPKYVYKFQNMYNKIKDFEKSQKRKITFQSISHQFFEDLVYYLNSRGYRNNYANKILAFFKTFLIWSLQNKYHDNQDFRSYKLREQEKEIIVLTKQELQTIENKTDLPGRLERVRDIFMVQVAVGQRVSDLGKLTEDNIKNIDGYYLWIFRTQKTKDNLRIPLTRKVLLTLEKYSYKLPLISNQRYNIYLKELCEECGIDSVVTITYWIGKKEVKKKYKKYELISSHTARRCFVSQSLQAGLSPEVIKNITGHKSTKMMERYLKFESQYVTENYLRVWDKDPELKLVQEG